MSNYFEKPPGCARPGIRVHKLKYISSGVVDIAVLSESCPCESDPDVIARDILVDQNMR